MTCGTMENYLKSQPKMAISATKWWLLIFVDEFISGDYDSKEYRKQREELNSKHRDVDPFSGENW